MILIADSGSTKTEWRLIKNSSSSGQVCFTEGINPFYQTTNDIIASLGKDYSLVKKDIDKIFFYGAGCANEEKNEIVRQAIDDFFSVKQIEINSDLLAAARATCKNKEGIACILGTGSNSCFYNGKGVVKSVSPLGYILGDEGSGAVLGKQLIADVLKRQLPEQIVELFYEEYRVSSSEILEAVYKQPFPNRFLAQYTKFLSKYIHLPELEALVLESFNGFIIRNLLQYSSVKELEIHFVGSIAFYFKDQLKKALEMHCLKMGSVCLSPMNGLVDYHYNYLIPD